MDIDLPIEIEIGISGVILKTQNTQGRIPALTELRVSAYELGSGVGHEAELLAIDLRVEHGLEQHLAEAVQDWIVVPVLHAHVVEIGQVALVESPHEQVVLAIEHGLVETRQPNHRDDGRLPDPACACHQAEEAVEEEVEIGDDVVGRQVCDALLVVLQKDRPDQVLERYEFEREQDEERQEQVE